MEKFIKTTAKELTGLEKAAILLAEIGPTHNENYADLEKAMHLSPAEMKKIRRTMENFEKYDFTLHEEPVVLSEIKRENAVLTEFLNFCQMKGFYDPSAAAAKKKAEADRMASEVKKETPEAIAKILSSWIGK